MKKRQVVFSIVLMLMLLCTSVYATISGSISLESSKTGSLTAGDEFTVTLSLDNISSTKGITSINGYININENILEDLTVNSIVTNSDGKVEINSNNILSVYDAATTEATNADTGITFNTNPTSGNGDYRLVIDLANAINSKTNLVTIKFKVKSDVTEGTYEDAISYTLFKIYSGTEEKADVVSKSLDITVGATNSDDNNSNNNGDDNTEPDLVYDFKVTTIDGTTKTVEIPSGKTLIDIFETYQDSNVSSITLEWTNSGEVSEASNFTIDSIINSLKNTASTIIVRGYDSSGNNVIIGTYTLKDDEYSLVLSTKSSNGDGSGESDQNNNNANNNQNNNNSANSANQNNSANNSANNSNNQGSNSTNNAVDNTTASGTLPYTGYKFIVIPIIVIAIAGFIFYRKYNTYNKF